MLEITDYIPSARLSGCGADNATLCGEWAERLRGSTSFTLAECQFSNASFDAFLTAIAGESSLEQLALIDGTLCADQIEKLMAVVSVHPSLDTLDVSGNDLGDGAVYTICKVLSQCGALHTLSLSRIGMSDIGLKHLAQTVSAHSSLQMEQIDLSRNSLTNDSLAGLNTMVGSLPTLLYLKLSGNQIDPEVIKEIKRHDDLLIDGGQRHSFWIPSRNTVDPTDFRGDTIPQAHRLLPEYV
jgi:Ran GTPase-activating protein (RanGAP) involved in mRNA processing and transport